MNHKRAITLIARIGISIAFLAALLVFTPSFDRSELLPDWDSSTPLWLVAALVLTAASFAVATVRWHRVLFAFEIESSRPRLFSHYMAGQFVSNFVPTTVGGDVVRVNRLRRDTSDAPASFASVVFERLSGWIVLPVLTFIGLALNPGLRDLGAATRVAMVLALAAIGGLATIIWIVGHDRLGGFLGTREGRLRYFNALHLGIDKFRAHPREVGRVLVTAFSYQVVLLAAAACAAEAMGIDEIGFTAILAFLPATLIAQFLSPGIGGLGFREGALVLFLNPLGVPEERAIALGLLLYFLTLVASLIGLPALVFGGKGREDTHIESEIASLPT
ncbi:MAG: flippase-like domain-containing protein [Acidimicrobiia bacterium]|nr:flippase-like domain-containing protein [Acidimicrobiia bacterium]